VARSLNVYPKAVLTGASWLFIVKVYEAATGTSSRFEHTISAGVTAETPLTLLKLSFDMVVDDTDTDQDVDDALFVDDIRPGPQVETVWGNWQELAEVKISGLSSGYTVDDFSATWSKQNTNTVRQDVKRALITQRGWSVLFVHQHEGDRSVTEE